MREFEKKIQKTKEILEKLMQQEITLKESVELYKEGMKELKEAQKMLEEAKLEIEEIKRQ
jgi:exodeoxyribonuclease VII small subunit